MSPFSRADVVMANLGSPPDEVKGHEQGFSRPVVIIQVFEYSDLVVIVPFSSRYQTDRLFPVVRISAGSGGLTQDSWAMCQQVRSISTVRLGRKLGSLADPQFEAIALVLADFLDL